jgi:hypothetical protein
MRFWISYCAAALPLLAACANPTTERGGASVENTELALQESALTAQVDALVADAADQNSRFDIGQGFDNAAQQLAEQLAQELPCAAVTRSGSTLNIVYDAVRADCTWHGRKLAGRHSVRVMRNADNEVSVHHELDDFRDEKLSLTGTADVKWSRTSGSRRVEHALTFVVLSGSDEGLTGDSEGDSTQLTLEDGVRINGLRKWRSAERGTYVLEMQAIEQRFADSVPQQGAYELTLPTKDALTFAFGRIDTDNIRVTVQGAQQDLSFVVRADGTIER